MGKKPQPPIAALLAGLVLLPTVQDSESETWKMDVLWQDIFICSIHPNCGTQCAYR